MGSATAFEVECAECGRTRGGVRFATERLCFACYRRRERAQKAAQEDFHTPSGRQRGQHAQLVRNSCTIQTALIGIGASVPQRDEILLHVRTTLRGKLEPTWKLIEPDLVKAIKINPGTTTANGEQHAERAVHVQLYIEAEAMGFAADE